MSTAPSILRLQPPERVADSEQIAPLRYTYEDTARLLAISVRTVKRLIAKGELATAGQGRLKRILYASILAYIERHRNEVCDGQEERAQPAGRYLPRPARCLLDNIHNSRLIGYTLGDRVHHC